MAQEIQADWMTFDERMREVAGILATGILRRRRRQMNQIRKEQAFSARGLDVSAGKSVHSTNALPKGENR